MAHADCFCDSTAGRVVLNLFPSLGATCAGAEVEGEGGAFFYFGGDGDVAAVAVHDLTADAEADAGAAGLGGEEGDEDFIYYVGKDAETVVGDGDEREGSGREGGFHDDFGRRLGAAGFAGVLDKVDKYLLDEGAVCHQA